MESCTVWGCICLGFGATLLVISRMGRKSRRSGEERGKKRAKVGLEGRRREVEEGEEVVGGGEEHVEEKGGGKKRRRSSRRKKDEDGEDGDGVGETEMDIAAQTRKNTARNAQSGKAQRAVVEGGGALSSAFASAFEDGELDVERLNASLAKMGNTGDEDGDGDEEGEEGEELELSEEEGEEGEELELSGEDEEDVEDVEPTAFGKAFAKVLGMDVPEEGESVVLAKNKSLLRKINADIKAEKRKTGDAALLRRVRKERCHNTKPEAYSKVEREMSKFATMGVVQLFNAVSKHQRALQKELDDKLMISTTEEKKTQMSFLDLLKQTQAAQASGVAAPKPQVAEVDESSKPAYLRTGYATSRATSIKDWDKVDSDSE